MNEKHIRQTLQDIAAAQISNETDLWPEIARKGKRPFPFNILRWSAQLAGAAVTLLALFLFAAWFLSISRSPVIGDASNKDNAQIRPTRIAQVESPITTQLVFPSAPEALPRYNIEILPSPQTPEEILAWANTFNMPEPKLFRDPRSPGHLLVIGSDGSRLIFMESSFSHPIISFSRNDWLNFSPGETISLEAGTAAAQSFLAQHNQLPADFQAVDQLSPMFGEDGNPIRIIQFTPGLNGYPVLQSAMIAIGANVVVDSTGEIVSAGFAEARFTEADIVNVRPAEEVVSDFMNGRLIPLAQELMPPNFGWGEVTIYHPPLPEHTVGERVTVLETDDTHFLVAVDGPEVRATLATSVGGKYELVTPELAHITDIIGNDDLQVTGTIEAQLAPDTWRLVVESWETLPQLSISSGCATGPVIIDEEGIGITAESVMGDVVRNGRYRLENLPSTIQNGDQIEVCGNPIPVVGETFTWSRIYAPPRNLSQHVPVTEPAFVIESIQLVYFYDLEDPALALAAPVWMVTGHDNANQFVAYLNAVK